MVKHGKTASFFFVLPFTFLFGKDGNLVLSVAHPDAGYNAYMVPLDLYHVCVSNYLKNINIGNPSKGLHSFCEV